MNWVRKKNKGWMNWSEFESKGNMLDLFGWSQSARRTRIK